MAKLRKSSFTVQSEPNVTLAGKYWSKDQTNSEEKHPMLIFVHQYAKMGGQAAIMESMAKEAVMNHGYHAITFDLRGAGRSTGYSTYTNFHELKDVQAIVDHVSNQYQKDIFLIGSSAGAPLVGAALDYSPRIRGAMMIGYVWGFFASFLFGWAYTPLRVSSKPKLFIVGDRDEFTSMSTYHQKLAELPPESIKEMKVIEGKNHFEIEAPVYDFTVTNWMNDFIHDHKLHSPEEIQACQIDSNLPC